MPICNVTLEYDYGLAEKLLNSSYLQFDEVRKHGDSTVKRYYTPIKYRDFAFVIYPNTGKVIMKGSWHKFHNNGLHNHDRYITDDLENDIINLSERFNYDFSNGLIHGVEAGVNLDLSALPQPYFSSGYLIPQVICYQGRKPFLPMKSIRGAGLGVECTMCNYRLKLYDKGKQHHLDYPLLRFEYDCNNIRELRSMHIHVLRDLADPLKLAQLGNKFLRLLSDIIVMEPLMIEKLSTIERKLYQKAERPVFWQGLNPRKRSYYLSRFRELMQLHSHNQLHRTICKQAKSEWNILTQSINSSANSQPSEKTFYRTENCNIFSPVNCEKRDNT